MGRFIALSQLGYIQAAAILLLCSHARAADFYVAADGDDTSPGTLEKPFRTVERGEMAASPGDTVYIRGGEYHFSGTQETVGVAFTKSGSSGQPIKYFAYQDEVPIFDLFDLKPQARVTGLDVRCNWIHIRGLEVRGVRQLIVGDSWSVRIRGDHNVIERLNVHDGEAPGIFITSGASNLILNCDSHHNYDPLEDGGNADGFGCHSTGGDNVLRGCRAYENSDDGFDFINAAGTCTAEESWAFRNGFIPETDTRVGNGAGFKSGGFGNPPNVPATGVPRHVIRKSLAFANLIGFYANYHPGGIDFFNNTAFDNPANFDMRTAGGTSTHKLRNNIAAGTGKTIVNFNGGTDDFNSWTLPVDVSSADFISMDTAIGLSPRQADGSLPSMSLMRLVDGSDLIDRGEDVGLPFTGDAPDLGAYEWGEAVAVGPIDAGAPDAAISVDSGTPMSTGSGGAQANPGGTAGVRATPSGSGGSTQPPRAGMDAMAQKPGTSPAQGPLGMAEGDGETQAGGCGCRVSPTRTRGSANALILALAAIALLLRSRRRRGSA